MFTQRVVRAVVSELMARTLQIQRHGLSTHQAFYSAWWANSSSRPDNNLLMSAGRRCLLSLRGNAVCCAAQRHRSQMLLRKKQERGGRGGGRERERDSERGLTPEVEADRWQMAPEPSGRPTGRSHSASWLRSLHRGCLCWRTRGLCVSGASDR